jgi:hypothetical protein
MYIARHCCPIVLTSRNMSTKVSTFHKYSLKKVPWCDSPWYLRSMNGWTDKLTDITKLTVAFRMRTRLTRKSLLYFSSVNPGNAMGLRFGLWSMSFMTWRLVVRHKFTDILETLTASKFVFKIRCETVLHRVDWNVRFFGKFHKFLSDFTVSRPRRRYSSKLGYWNVG